MASAAVASAQIAGVSARAGGATAAASSAAATRRKADIVLASLVSHQPCGAGPARPARRRMPFRLQRILSRIVRNASAAGTTHRHIDAGRGCLAARWLRAAGKGAETPRAALQNGRRAGRETVLRYG